MLASAQPNKFTNFFQSLEKASPYEISNQWFHNQTFFLDGYAFKNCRFDNCKLFLNRPVVVFEHCVVTGCELTFLGDAQRAVKVCNLFHPDHGLSYLNLSPIYHEDGTFSLS